MLRTVILLQCIHCTCVADGTHQTSTWSPLNLSSYSAVAPRFVSRRRRNMCQVSIARRWQLASRRCLCFFRGPKGCKSLIFTLPAELATGYGATAWTVWAILPRDRIWRSEIYSSLGFLRRTWLASDLQQTPTWSKLSPSGYRHMPQISSTGYRPWCHCWETSFNVTGDHVHVWCVSSAAHVSPTDVWCVSSATHVSRTVQRIQKDLGTRVSDIYE
jgi:hypothetical protein